MANYIIVSEAKDQSPKRALFFLPSVGRRRYFRQSIDGPDKSLTILTSKRKSRAEEVCFIVNGVYNDDFKVEEYNPNAKASN
jgi:hypothetical protein